MKKYMYIYKKKNYCVLYKITYFTGTYDGYLLSRIR